MNYKYLTMLCLSVALAFVGGFGWRSLTANDSSAAQTIQMAKTNDETNLIGEFAPTFYRTLNESADEWQSDESLSEPILAMNGKELEKVRPAFKHQLDIEGSGRLRDGRVVNFATKRDNTWRYFVVKDNDFGVAANGDALVPFRTIAVDPSVIPLGTVLYIPELVGIKLPDGTTHDGYVLAHDTGQGILGNRIDVFVGYEVDVDNTLTRSGKIRNMRAVHVNRVNDQTAEKINDRFRDQFER